MKKILLILIGISIYISAYPQRKGYKDIEIGTSLDDIVEKYDVRIVEKDTSKTYVISGQNLKICDRDIEYITFNIDKEELITQVQVVTKEFAVSNIQWYLDDIKNFSGCFINSIGRPNSVNMDKGDKNSMAWDLKDESILVAFFIENMSTFAENQNRRYSIFWSKLKKTKMW